ncbi:MAG: FAD-dependent oxidoreductase [Syntrophobacteraceae bacterium]
MRTEKERLHRVLVVGATPAGIAATNKLGELGIPVTLVDPSPDLDRKLAAEEWRLSSGLTYNYANRPGLLRILRNPRIRLNVPGEITSIKHTPQGFSARIRTHQTYIDPDHCTLCGNCSQVCPVTCGDGSKPLHYNGRQSLPGRPFIDKRQTPLCQANCPLGVNAQGYMALARAGRFEEALELIRRDNVLPGICGRICTHPCESACRRSELDEPLAIRDVKRFVADFELKQRQSAKGGPTTAPAPSPCRAEKIAVIGSGPSGLAAAADLARLGYGVVVFEREQQAGGLLRYGIGPHRLPRDILDTELAAIEALGVEFRLGAEVSLTKDLEKLQQEYGAVIVATGAWRDRKLGVPGEDLPGVSGCIEFLCSVYRGQVTTLKDKVAVIGDGNAAFDLARVLKRLGADVTILSWFPYDMIPADAEEVEAAREESIAIIDRRKTVAYLGENGRLKALRCAPTEPGPPDANGIPWPVLVPGGETVEMAFDRAFVAIGQAADVSSENGVKKNPQGYLQVDDRFRTNLKSVYAAGDTAQGPSSVVHAMASGRQVARMVHEDLTGELAPSKKLRTSTLDFVPISPNIPKMDRADMPERQAQTRLTGFDEVALGLTEVQVLAEASRCLQCGSCSECLECARICGAVGSLQHDEEPIEDIEHVGVVILADPSLAPAIKGEDVIRAYSTKTAKNDVYALIMRGFAAAAEAMVLLGSTGLKMRGHGMSFSPPDPQLESDIRMGVFACRCNTSLGWSDELDGYIGGLSDRPGVVHAQTIDSACAPEGSAAILRTIREKGLTRVVLASCVCCPLDFICSACTDQRSRLKDAIFNGTGVSRAMVETCNARGEVLRLLSGDPDLAVARFKGLIDRSISRARRLKAMPSPARPYNFTTAVIGDSEAALKSALTLAEAGMEVFLFGAQDRPLTSSVSHPNIHSFDGSSVKGLAGTVGDFSVIVEMGGTVQVLHVGAVIIGEQSRKRIHYVPSPDLPTHLVASAMQQRGTPGIPFFMPGATSISGLFLASPAGVHVTDRVKGGAAALMAATVMPRKPRQNKGYTVVVDDARCRGCGRCNAICPYQAVNFRDNAAGGRSAFVDEALCKGCGNCISVCPSNAADSPYRDRRYLEQMIDEILF